jgi:hypothetical protein
VGVFCHFRREAVHQQRDHIYMFVRIGHGDMGKTGSGSEMWFNRSQIRKARANRVL